LIGFRVLVSRHPAIQATGPLTSTPAGLTPAEHASLSWTHNRTCTSQRIRLSIQVSLKAKTIYGRSQRASVDLHAASHQFALPFTYYQRSSPHYGQLIRQANHSDCLPSPCDRLSRSRTTTEAPPACTSSGAHSLSICASLPQFTCWTQSHGRGCLSQSLSLLSASRRRYHGLAARSP
jgi:hypothetical protein